MSDIAIFKTGKVAEYLKSVNTPDYSSDPDVLINPDISAVDLVPIRYWKRVGDTIIEMTQGDKDEIAAQELTDRKNAANTYKVFLKDFATALVKVINIRLPAGQKITTAELITAVKAEII